MEIPTKYLNCNQIQRRDVKKVLDEFAGKIQWRLNGTETVLDIGCGAGDVTIDLILTHMPPKFGKLVGVDISEEMIEYAKRTYERDNISFEILDIESSDIAMLQFVTKHRGQFDHVMSFYCLQWVPNQRRAMKNIYNLLKPNGDCLLLIVINHPFFTIYNELTQTKWRYLMPSLDDFFADYHSRWNPAGYMLEILTDIGYRGHEVRIMPEELQFTGDNEIKANVTVVNPVWRKMNSEEQQEYLKDYLNIAARLGYYKKGVNENESTFASSYRLLIVNAIK